MYDYDAIYTAPPNSGEVILGRTLPSLLDEACDRYPNSRAFNQWTDGGWKSLSNLDFRTAAEELALGLLDVGLEKGDRVGLLAHSDVNFCIADMACLLAKLIDVPIFLGEPPETIGFIIQHSQAKALIVSSPELLHEIAPYLQTPNLKTIVIVQGTPKAEDFSQLLPKIQIFSLSEVRDRGQAKLLGNKQQELRSEIAPDDIATIIYIAGASGQLNDSISNRLPVLKLVNAIQDRLQNLRWGNYSGVLPHGVMLTHENISADILAAFTSHPELKQGREEVALLFLPLTHIFARAFLYGHINYGHSIYFTTPTRVVKHLKDIRPTIFITVPRLLEKVYEKILEKGGRTKGLTKKVFDWALDLAKRYELGQKPEGFYALQLMLADKVVYSKWRSVFGERLKALISGGAALRADIANIFSAAKIPILQGYGMTETSAVLCYNRGELNRAGTVGVPIAGVEIAIAEDGEILVKAPYLMKGYYKNPLATREVIDSQGWFHTGDTGEFTEEGFLKITGYKKNLFKLSTGKYVTPQPLETKLKQSPLVAEAIAVGAYRKFCTMLIFPDRNNLRTKADKMGLDMPVEALLEHPKIKALYQGLVDEANRQLPKWSMVKSFQLIDQLNFEKVMSSTPTAKRRKVSEAFAEVIDSLYGEGEKHMGILAVFPILKILYFSCHLKELAEIGIT
ncbi:MAG: AMP-binding protein [Prochloraceae cyanobacterium]|nr:AMP-binding protein [Prochloraceae cyanobacterium]